MREEQFSGIIHEPFLRFYHVKNWKLFRFRSCWSPLHSVMTYLTSRGNVPGPFFLFQNGRPLSRAWLTDWLRQILAPANIPGNFSSHSFRIGTATVAVRNGVPDHLIQALDRWSSSAYQLYIRTLSESLAALSTKLVSSQWPSISH